jgi:excisionase family DNA binding protein
VIFDETQLRALIRDAVREVIREELRRAPGRDEYLDVAAAAALAKVHPQTIRAWIADGRLTRYQAGRELRVLRAEIDAVLSAGGATPDPEKAALLALSRRRKAG